MLTHDGNSARCVARLRMFMLFGCGRQSNLSLGIRSSILRVVCASSVISFNSIRMISIISKFLMLCFCLLIQIEHTLMTALCQQEMEKEIFCRGVSHTPSKSNRKRHIKTTKKLGRMRYAPTVYEWFHNPIKYSVSDVKSSNFRS